jgi:polyhydroxybutyrate depolymerase
MACMTSRRRRLIVWTALGAGFIACVGFLGLLRPWRPATRTFESLEVEGATREYLLVVPRAVESKRVPLVVALHGTGDSPAAMSRYTRLDELASKHQFVLVYPKARGGMWQVMGDGALADNRDVRFMDALIERLSTRFPLDSERIYVVGMSNGATFAQLWAAQRSTQIAAVVGHSGTPPADMLAPERDFPVMLVVGAADTPATVEAVRVASESYRASGRPTDIRVVGGLGHAWSPAQNDEIWEFLSRFKS